METTKKYALHTALTLSLAAFTFFANAQNTKDNVASQQREHVLIAADTATNLETLSGINLKPTKKGTFQLDFSQVLKENAMLEITNTAGQMVYNKPIAAAKSDKAWRFDVGKLRPDTYLIEVKTSDTTYWTKFKIGR
ncbi:hypothetical protein [Pontibacter ruber]|uniref:Secreted protein (Por secretion system target) n=1 Tax=Pontibacter ruber TaxID=1343895 RepID=A0ABW5D1A5_9BACT|nr:hypothetical protein [Pontibacter ruber]